MGENMKLTNILNKNNISYREIEAWGVYYRQKWKDIFANHLSKEERDEIYLDYFLWHLFSYEKREYLELDKAREAFNSLKKGEIYIFSQHLDNLFIVKNGEELKAESLQKLIGYIDSDIYIVDKDFSWTYLTTHEEDCGLVKGR